MALSNASFDTSELRLDGDWTAELAAMGSLILRMDSLSFQSSVSGSRACVALPFSAETAIILPNNDDFTFMVGGIPKMPACKHGEFVLFAFTSRDY